MKRYPALTAVALVMLSCSTKEYDVCIYGGTSAGVTAAYSAARSGLDVVLVEPGEHIGGMTSGGLGYTDIGNKQVIKGVAKDFYRRVGNHYGVLEQWIFEPSVADSIMRSYLDDRRIRLKTGFRIVSAEKDGSRISSIRIEKSSAPHKAETLRAKYYVDCSYEGDLLARSGVSFVVGREANDRYGETLNGVELMDRHQFPDGIDPYRVKGDPSSGLLWGISDAILEPDGTGDAKVQAYNFRICLTDSLQNSIPIEKPEDYDPLRYELLLRLMEAYPEKTSLNDWFIWSRMPNRKTDINNRGGFSSDMIGMNHGYPEADYAERDSIFSAHVSYTKGLLYFIGHDPRVPETLRKKMLLWGYPKDEYERYGHWTPQLYVREARRMVGEYVATQADCEGRRAPFDGVAMAAYQMDSHNCQRIVVRKNGMDMVKNEGNVEVGGGLPYPVSYRSIVPVRSECTNLLVPVCLSASHIAYGSIRMEPVFMVLGQVAGIACALALENACCDIQDVDSRRINVIIDENPYMDGRQADLIIDDSDSEVTADALWTRCEKRGGYGLSYYESGPSDSLSEVVFPAVIPSAGNYSVYTCQPVSPGYSSVLNVAISCADGTYRICVPRSEMKVSGQTSDTWIKLGEYRFASAEEVTVAITNEDADAKVRADAVLFIKND
ncbi:MAG: FAD-dependent oxidoreductase [Candidatus Cryptobacteroides sp.]